MRERRAKRAFFNNTVYAEPRLTSMSNAIDTNARLLAAGVETQLFVQEGLGHGEFTLIPGTPEAAQAYDVIWRFFDRHLAKM